MKVGETKDIDLSFPENYASEELAGQAVVFTVKLPDFADAEAEDSRQETSGSLPSIKTAKKNTLYATETKEIRVPSWIDLFSKTTRSQYSKVWLSQDTPSVLTTDISTFVQNIR